MKGTIAAMFLITSFAVWVMQSFVSLYIGNCIVVALAAVDFVVVRREIFHFDLPLY